MIHFLLQLQPTAKTKTYHCTVFAFHAILIVGFCIVRRDTVGKSSLRIGQVAKLSGLTPRTIDYYTQRGLLEFERSPSNYRLYPESVLHTLDRIKLLKTQRMSLEEIIDAIQAPNSNNKVEPILCEVQDDINSLQQKLTALEEALKDAPQKEKQLVHQELSNKMAIVMQLLTLL